MTGPRLPLTESTDRAARAETKVEFLSEQVRQLEERLGGQERFFRNPDAGRRTATGRAPGN